MLMPISDRDKLNRVEELKSKLFSKNYQSPLEHRDRFTKINRSDVPENWGGRDGVRTDSFNLHGDKFFMKTPVFRNFFIFSLIFFALTVGYAAYMFLGGGNTVSNDNIDISIVGNNYTAGGEDLSLTVGIVNRNSSALDLVDLVMEYPRSSPGSGAGGMERMRQSLGTIPAGALRNENMKVILFGEQGSVIPIKIYIEYRVEGSNGIFVKEKSYGVTINSTPLSLSIDAPLSISPNQIITLNVKATLNATNPVSGILLKLDYPSGFQFTSSTPSPSLGNNVWNLGDLPPGAERNIAIIGRMADVFDGEEKSFHISSGSQAKGDKSVIGVVFNSLTHTVAVRKPFIEASLFVNGVSDKAYTTNSKTPIRGEIRWTNNLDTKVNDLQIRAKISGNAVDRKTITTEQGFYDSQNNVIIWDKNSQGKLSEVNPGDSGSVGFSLSPLSLFSASSGMLANPSVNVEVSISGKQLVQGYASVDLNNSDSATIRIISDVGFASKALYYSGPFKNTGPVPPKAEKETSYTITWSLSNTANNISKSVVRATIPQWMKFVGSISPASENLTYNSFSKEIVWNAGTIGRGSGINTAGRSVSFQIAITPSLSQVGTTPVIINEAVLTGHDDFANVEVRVGKMPLRTSLDNDPAFPANGGTVVE